MKKPPSLALALCLCLTLLALAAEDAQSCISIQTSTEEVSLNKSADALKRDVFVEVVSEEILENVFALEDGTKITISNKGGNSGIYVYFKTYYKVGPTDTIQYSDYETGELITVNNTAGKYCTAGGTCSDAEIMAMLWRAMGEQIRQNSAGPAGCFCEI